MCPMTQPQQPFLHEGKTHWECPMGFNCDTCGNFTGCTSIPPCTRSRPSPSPKTCQYKLITEDEFSYLTNQMENEHVEKIFDDVNDRTACCNCGVPNGDDGLPNCPDDCAFSEQHDAAVISEYLKIHEPCGRSIEQCTETMRQVWQDQITKARETLLDEALGSVIDIPSYPSELGDMILKSDVESLLNSESLRSTTTSTEAPK